MKRTRLLVVAILVVAILSLLLFFQSISEKGQNEAISTIDFSDTYSAVSTIYQRKAFFANGTHWLFYCNGTHLLCTTSSNGFQWNTPTTIMRLSSASALSLWYDGKVHYALAPGREGEPVIYRTGNIVGNYISWSNEQIAVQNITSQTYFLGTKESSNDFGTISLQLGVSSNKTQLLFDTPPTGSYFVFVPDETVKDPYGIALPTNCTGTGWRTENPFDSEISEGLWKIHIKLSNPNGAAHSGKALLKIWKIRQDNLQQVNLTNWIESENITFQSMGKDAIITVRKWLPETVFNNEYLFIEFGWKVIATSNSSHINLTFTLDETTRIISPAYEYYNAYCTVDSDGHPWVAYQRYDGYYWTAQATSAVSTEGNLWTSPAKLSDSSLLPLRTCVLPMTGARAYAIFVSELNVEGRLWNGAAWQQPEIITDQNPAHDYDYSAVSLGDEINMVLLQNATNNILQFRRFANGTWEKTILETNQGVMATPVLSIDPSKTDVMYCTWFQDRTLQLRKWENGTWKKDRSVNFNLTFPMALSCFYSTSDGNLGVAILDRIGPDERYELGYYVLKDL
jgi:hypothetical protein